MEELGSCFEMGRMHPREREHQEGAGKDIPWVCLQAHWIKSVEVTEEQLSRDEAFFFFNLKSWTASFKNVADDF